MDDDDRALTHVRCGCRSRVGGAEPPAKALAPRDPIAPLAVLGAREHWGRYRAPADQDAAPASEPQRPVDRNAIERDFVLVGIEGREPRLLALLLPREAEPRTAGNDEVIRLRSGDTLVSGVTVTAINQTSASFATGDGTATLQLYDDTP